MAYKGNPFTPTFGKVPFALAGRTEYIDGVIGALANRPGDPYRSVVFYGPRGSGKTVLMQAIEDYASEQGWVHADADAREGMLKTLTKSLRHNASMFLSEETQHSITSMKAGPFGFSREIYREEPSWQERLRGYVRELNSQNVGVLFVIDEANPECLEFREFISMYQYFVRENRDVAMLVGGLPAKVSALLVDDHVSFIRRAFQRPLEPIPSIEVEEALLQTIEGNGRRIEPEALAMCADATGGFAYAIQLVGYYLWRDTPQERDFQTDDAALAIKMMLHDMERSIFAPTLLALPNREEQYLYAMAQDEKPSSTSDIAKRMGISMTNASNIRKRLIEQGLIREIRMGVVDFNMPLLKDYLQSRL